MRPISMAAALLILVTAAPGWAQQPTTQTAAREKGPIRGFVYSGRLADGDGPVRWADYPVVSHVFSGSPAAAAGLRVGDAILRANGRDGTETEGYRGGGVGSTYTLVVQRGFQEVEISFVLIEPTWLASEWAPPAGSHTTRRP